MTKIAWVARLRGNTPAMAAALCIPTLVTAIVVALPMIQVATYIKSKVRITVEDARI